jgi:hypothetical protein
MHSVRYETVGRDTHRHGRVSCLLDVDVRQKKLFVSSAMHPLMCLANHLQQTPHWRAPFRWHFVLSVTNLCLDPGRYS